MDLVQKDVRALLQSALEVALVVVRANPAVLEGLGAHLEGRVREIERVERERERESIIDSLLVAYCREGKGGRGGAAEVAEACGGSHGAEPFREWCPGEELSQGGDIANLSAVEMGLAVCYINGRGKG